MAAIAARLRSLARVRVLVVLAILLAVLAGAYRFWLRDSSLVAVTEVKVTGATGADAEPIAAALSEAAGEMTTLHVRQERLREVVAGFPSVTGVSAEADFPHGLAIAVQSREPALTVRDGARTAVVAADGTVLSPDEKAGSELPEIDSGTVPPPGARLEGEPLELALVAGAAPEPMRALIKSVERDGPDGVQVTLRGRLPVIFGTGAEAPAKWAAAVAALADPKLDSLTYLDVRVPERPAAGGVVPAEPLAPDPAAAAAPVPEEETAVVP